MNPVIKAIRFLGECGARFTESTLDDIVTYFVKMMSENRILIIEKDNMIYALMCISLCDNWNLYWRKHPFTYLPHNVDSKNVYIENITTKKYDKEMRTVIERELVEKYPQLETACWHIARPNRPDRLIQIGRKNNVRNQNIK